MFVLDPPRLSDAYADEPPVAIVAPPPVAGFEEGRFRKQERLGEAGSITVGAGLASVLAGGTLLLGSAMTCIHRAPDGTTLFEPQGNACAPAAVVGAVLLVGGAGAYLVGEVLVFVGGISAGYTGRNLGLATSPTLGWVGVGLIGGSMVLSFAGTGDLAEIWTVTSLAGTICGVIQVANVGAAGRRGGIVAIVPTNRGLQLTGTF